MRGEKISIESSFFLRFYRETKCKICTIPWILIRFHEICLLFLALSSCKLASKIRIMQDVLLEDYKVVVCKLYLCWCALIISTCRFNIIYNHAWIDKCVKSDKATSSILVLLKLITSDIFHLKFDETKIIGQFLRDCCKGETFLYKLFLEQIGGKIYRDS